MIWKQPLLQEYVGVKGVRGVSRDNFAAFNCSQARSSLCMGILGMMKISSKNLGFWFLIGWNHAGACKRASLSQDPLRCQTLQYEKPYPKHPILHHPLQSSSSIPSSETGLSGRSCPSSTSSPASHSWSSSSIIIAIMIIFLVIIDCAQWGVMVWQGSEWVEEGEMAEMLSLSTHKPIVQSKNLTIYWSKYKYKHKSKYRIKCYGTQKCAKITITMQHRWSCLQSKPSISNSN